MGNESYQVGPEGRV